MAYSSFNSHQIMENATRFDLNEAIHHWRVDLQNSPALGFQDLEELESHLRDSIATLKEKGLSSEESFWVAKNRIGPISSLQDEFGKVNPMEIWENRVMWMVIGVLAIGAIGTVASMIKFVAMFGIIKFTAAPGWTVGGAELVAYVAAFIGLYYWGWRLGDQHGGLVSKVCDWTKRHPKATGAIVLLLTIVSFAATLASSVVVYKNLTPQGMRDRMLWMYPTQLFTILFWPCVLTWLQLEDPTK